MGAPPSEAGRGPLTGIRVIDLSAVISGPMASGMLADQGAEVIKIETRAGDLTRRVGPSKGDMTPLFAAINRGKRSMVLDLKQAAACEILTELLTSADVLVENFRPGALARLGFGYDEVRACNPGIVYLSISGFGHDGPSAQQRVYDPVIQAASGFAAAHPHPQTGEPQLLQTALCDKITALTAAQAVTAALLDRERTGQGQLVRVSMLDAALSFLWPEALYNHSLLDGAPPPVPEFGASQRLWRASDGWFAMITPQDDEFAAMCRVLGREDLLADPRFTSMVTRRNQQAVIRELLEPIVAQHAVVPLVARLAHAGVPVGHVNMKETLAQDPQVRHNACLVDVQHPGGIGRVRMARPAARFERETRIDERPAPMLGEHSRDILRELGRSEDAVSLLLTRGAVA